MTKKALKGQICYPKRGNIDFDKLRGIFRDDQDGQKVQVMKSSNDWTSFKSFQAS